MRSVFRHWLCEELQGSQPLFQRIVIPNASPAVETHAPGQTPLDQEVRTKSVANTPCATHIILLYSALDSV